ncbi:MAG: methionyl-tRNA formyltransferase [Aestuariivirga sp.]|nr:methionyl-tRNA formyltransferase [Aestuariivirga sp.]
MKLVFMGTPDFAVVTLKALVAAGHEIVAVYSQPPRPAGRGQSLRPSPVQDYAAEQGIEARTPHSLKSTDEQKSFADLKADAAVVVAYGLLLPQAILDAPRFGCFNVHASLLPRWRGAAPIQRAIMAGDAESGVTIMRMELGLDTGPMMKVGRAPITPETTASSLHDELAALGAKLMLEVLNHPENAGTLQPVEGVTYAKKIDKAETKIDFSRPAPEVRNHIHGLSPFPGAWCVLAGARVKILKAQAVDHAMKDALTFACGNGAIKFLLLQREGKGVMDAATFLRGFPIAADMKPT